MAFWRTRCIRTMMMGVVALSGAHCAAAAPADDGAGGDTTEAELVVGDPLTPHCYAEIERPDPTDKILPIGMTVKVRTNPSLSCPPGAPSEPLVYRFYVEGPSGKFSL